MTIHLFILEALVCAGLYTKVKQGGGPDLQCIDYADLRKEVSFLSQLFRGEFIFPPEGLDTNLAVALARLESDNVLKVTRDPSNVEKVTSVALSDAERKSGRENYDFYCFLIWPFIEASWLGAVSLLMLTPPIASDGDGDAAEPDRWIDSKAAQDRAQLLGKTLYHQGDLSYFEAVNKETLRNAYQRFAEDGIIEVSRGEPDSTRLTDAWLPRRDPRDGAIVPEGRLWALAEAISQSRREGKNRRDGGTVLSRVLKLVDVVGGALWEGKGGKGGREEGATKKRRRSIQAGARL
jgi:Glycerol-3-phosphate acyltransferase C-terminal region